MKIQRNLNVEQIFQFWIGEHDVETVFVGETILQTLQRLFSQGGGYSSLFVFSLSDFDFFFVSYIFTLFTSIGLHFSRFLFLTPGNMPVCFIIFSQTSWQKTTRKWSYFFWIYFSNHKHVCLYIGTMLAPGWLAVWSLNGRATTSIQYSMPHSYTKYMYYEVYTELQSVSKVEFLYV